MKERHFRGHGKKQKLKAYWCQKAQPFRLVVIIYQPIKVDKINPI